MNSLLRLSRAIDALNERIGHLVYWLILAAALVSAGNASVRYTFDTSSNAWLELQWYLYSAVFLLCAGYTLLHNEHVRIDVICRRSCALGSTSWEGSYSCCRWRSLSWSWPGR